MISPVMIEESERMAVVETAKSWLGTPYHHMGRIKKAGADCLTFIAEVFHEAGLVPKVDIEYYPMDWHLHRDSERYMNGLLKYVTEITENPRAGDIVLWKFGRCFSHGAIVIEWPLVIHSYMKVGVILENADQPGYLQTIGENVANRGKERPRKFFSYWGK